MILHIPHSSSYIPPESRGLFCSQAVLEQELLVMTDLFTDELFDYPCQRIVFPISRLVCDVERFRDPVDEMMTAKGMWVCYTKTSGGADLKTLTDGHIADILTNYYDAHHRKLEAAAENELAKRGRAMIVDCHSFPSAPLPYEPDQDGHRPDFCLGTDPYHTPPELVELCRNHLHGRGYTVAENRPFAGTIVPMRHLYKEQNVRSIMIEVNRKLYCDEKAGSRLDAFDRVKKDIACLLARVDEAG